MSDAHIINITALGAQGDGVAQGTDGIRHVPFALPGEQVRISDPNQPEIITTSPDRARPVCRHFGVCGGCVAQHMTDTLYAEWKRGIVIEAFRQRGLEPEIGPLLRVPLGSRRRAVLTARRTGSGVVLGYHRRRSHNLFAVEECPVLRADVVGRLPALRVLADALNVREARLIVLCTRAGLDVTVDAKLSATQAARLASIAVEYGFARLTVGRETVAQRTKPTLDVGGVELAPPSGAFVQAVREAEDAMVECVRQTTRNAKHVADLFAGIGTFTLALARRARVLAIDSDKEALVALTEAARHAQGLKPIETRVRDLFRDPMSPRELQDFGAVAFDPPRAGAKAQAEALARSRVPTIVAVSCNPATLARDARILADGGYELESVTPIDQFVYSAHVEVTAVLRRHR